MIEKLATIDTKPQNEIGGSLSDVSNNKIDTSKPIDFSRPDEVGGKLDNSKLDTSREQDYSNDVHENESENFSDYKERLDQTPKDSDKGTWKGERGESEYVPNDTPENKEIKDYLNTKGIEGLEYKNACADFSPVAEESVEIQNMTNDRYGRPDGNFMQAYNALAEKFNAQAKDGKTDWTFRDIIEWKQDKSKHEGQILVVHERNDLKVCDFVRLDVHSFFSHLGGVGEYNAKMKQNNIGGFDE